MIATGARIYWEKTLKCSFNATRGSFQTLSSDEFQVGGSCEYEKRSEGSEVIAVAAKRARAPRMAKFARSAVNVRIVHPL
jgi:hypothetical protein